MLAALLVLAAGGPSEPAQQELAELIASMPPSDPIVGVASRKRGDLTDERWSSVVALLDSESSEQGHARYRFLGQWNKRAREEVLAAGIDLVLVIQDAVAKKKKAKGATYESDDGDRVYVRTEGAYARTEVELVSIEPSAHVIARWTDESDKGKSWSVFVSEEEKKARSARRSRDPEALLDSQDCWILVSRPTPTAAPPGSGTIGISSTPSLQGSPLRRPNASGLPPVVQQGPSCPWPV